ncbi:hypothetical protein D3C77_799400 [compost metagenome]
MIDRGENNRSASTALTIPSTISLQRSMANCGASSRWDSLVATVTIMISAV